jgi:hypothetical protein
MASQEKIRTIEEWLLDTTKYQDALKNAASEIRNSNKIARDAALVQQAMAGAMDTTAKATAGMRGSMIAANLASAALTKGIGLLSRSLGSVLMVARNWEDHIGGNVKTVDSMSAAVDGLISKLDLARTASVLGAEGFALTQRQLDSLGKAAIQYARINKIAFKPALDAITDIVIGGRDTGLRRLGIDIELTGSKSEKAAKAVALLEGKFGDLAISAENTNEVLGQSRNAIEDAWGEMTLAITQSTAWRDALGGVRDMIVALTGAQKDLTKQSASFRQWFLDYASLLGAAGNKSLQAAFRASLDLPGLMPAAAEGPFAERAGPTLETPLRGGKGKKKASGGGGIDVSAFAPARGVTRALGAAFDPAQRAFNEWALANEQEHIDLEIRRAQALRVVADEQERVNAALRYEADAMRTMHGPQRMAIDAVTELGDVLDNVASSLWQAADAAIQSGQSFGAAVLQVVKAELMGVASRATIKALEATALGFLNLAYMNFPAAGWAFASAGMWTALAAAAGGGGLAIGAATKSSTGAGSSARSRGIDAPGAFSSAAADSKRDKEKEINVYVYLGDKYDRSAQLYMQRTAEGRAA